MCHFGVADAQVRQRTENPRIGGAIPPLATISLSRFGSVYFKMKPAESDACGLPGHLNVGRQAAELVTIRATGLICAKALRAFQVGKARTIDLVL